MTHYETLQHFRSAAVFAPDFSGNKSTLQDIDAAEYAARHYKVWLTPNAVAEINSRDFLGLRDAEKQQLDSHCQQFLTIAEEVETRGEASREQISEALQHFQAIRKLIEPHTRGTWNSELVQALFQIITDPATPDYIVGFDYDLGDDSTGEPSLWVWIVIDDTRVKLEEAVSQLPTMYDRISSVLEELKIERNLYLGFRSLEEQMEIVRSSPE